jgi:hypothetical protein
VRATSGVEHIAGEHRIKVEPAQRHARATEHQEIVLRIRV